MRLKEGFVLAKAGDDFVAVPSGSASRDFQGLIRNNSTAAFIFEKLQQETTREALIEALLERYEVEEEMAARDVDGLLRKMKEAGILEGVE